MLTDERILDLFASTRGPIAFARAILAESQPVAESRVAQLQAVDFYEREFYPLSNFSSFMLQWRTILFATSEHAYHYEKFTGGGEIGRTHRECIRSSLSAHAAFKYAEKYRADRHPDWDECKVSVMRQIIRAKAEQHEYVRRKLLETGNRRLIEGSWRDDYWGIGPNGDGQNKLGELWMELRTELQAARALRSTPKEPT